MSAGHLCVRSALNQAFRVSNSRTAASCTISEFLVPAVAGRIRRPFSSTRRKHRPTTTHAPEPAQQSATSRPRPPRRRPLIGSRIPIPGPDDCGDIQQWLAAIDPFLPPHLQHPSSDGPDASETVTSLDFAAVLIGAQDFNHDILSHYGLEEERWDTMVWIAKKLVEDGTQSTESRKPLDSFAEVMWRPKGDLRTLRELTNDPLWRQRVYPPSKLGYTLDDLTAIPETINPPQTVIKRGIGQLWRSLGNLIVAAAGPDDQIDNTIMSHVLEVIAHLHHIGFMPDSVYANKAPLDEDALQQPPTLHLLSTKILTALSDAAWRSHEAAVKEATGRQNAAYFLGHEIPGSRVRVQVTELAPELWLELILWTCLHGDWISDGTAILKQLSLGTARRRWGLISWRELLQAKGRELENFSDWRLLRFQRSKYAGDRSKIRRTISGEVVTAFVDGLVNTMRLGVGARGTNPEDLVDSIKQLKRFLDANSLSLGSTTWDAVISRLLESGGLVSEKRPELLLSILDLASAFGTEVSTINAPPTSAMAIADPNSASVAAEPPYFYEPTTVALSLLHRTIQSYIKNGDIAGAMITLRALQQHTDNNKQKSLEQFFEAIKSVTLRHDEPFTSQFPPIEFPAFENQLSIPLLAKLLDLATESRLYDLGRWFLFADDLDGPLIPPAMYSDWVMAASIIRFGTLAGENNLVLKMMKNSEGYQRNQRFPRELLTALLDSQIKLHRWESVQGIQDYVVQSPGYHPKSELLATFGAELLRLSARTEAQSLEETSSCVAFTKFLFTWEDLLLRNLRNELYCILGILSTVHGDWKRYCSQFLAFSTLQPIKLSTEDFNHLLGGVLDSYGSLKGREIVDRWCYKPPKTFEPYRAPGGLPTMSTYRVPKSDEYESRPENIEIIQESGAKLILQGRVNPNRQTVWAILRKVQREEDEQRQKGGEVDVAKRAEVRETLKWGARLLYYLGFDYEDIMRDLGSLADLAELEAPLDGTVVGGGEKETLQKAQSIILHNT